MNFFRESTTSPKHGSLLGVKRKKPCTLADVDTSAASKRPGTPRPTPISGRTATSFECGEFWRYFQNASQLAFIVLGGGDAVIGRKEARQLLANFRGTAVESIAKTDSGLLHICGLSVRQLHDFINNLWRVGSFGMSVIKDLSIGSTKGPSKKALLKSQKKRFEEHIRSHSVSVVHECEDFLEVDGDCDTREDLLPPPMPVIGHMQGPVSFSLLGDLGASFEDEVKMDRPSMSLLKTVELEMCKAEELRKSRLLLCVESAIHGVMPSICCSLTSWLLEDDVEDDVLSLGSFQSEDGEEEDYGYGYEAHTPLCSYGSSPKPASVCSKRKSQSMASLSSECRQWPDSDTPKLSHLRQDSEEIIYLDYEGFDSPRKAASLSLSLSLSLSERLATLMHAPVGV